MSTIVITTIALLPLVLPAVAIGDESSAHSSRRISKVGSESIVDPLDKPIQFSPQRPAAAASAVEGHGPSANRATTTVIGSLAVCLGAFLLFVWATRRTVPRGLTPLPNEVVELLGRASLAARQQLQLVRVGKKLVLVAVSPTGVSTLTEITDDAEVERLAGLCQQNKPNSASSAFRDVLGQYAQEPAASGFVGDGRKSDFELASRGGRRRPTRRENDDA